MLNRSSIIPGMRALRPEIKKRIVACLVEGMSVRATCRITEATKGAVLNLLVELGEACQELHDEKVRNVRSKRIQADEIWSFVGMKEKQAKDKGADRPAHVGDVWTWTAIDADSKLAISWLVGGRDSGYAYEFMSDVAGRVDGRVQVTTDGHGAYLNAVPDAFGFDVDYAQLVKRYGEDPTADKRYSPAVCLGVDKNRIIGNPDSKHVSTSYVERANLTMRMAMRRFTRLTNAFSKKIENHAHAVALHFTHYNFCRVHQSLRVTPAMEAGLTDHVWTIEELLALVPAKSNLR